MRGCSGHRSALCPTACGDLRVGRRALLKLLDRILDVHTEARRQEKLAHPYGHYSTLGGLGT